MKKIAVMLGLVSCYASAHSMQPTIKEYVAFENTMHKVMLMNSSKKSQCYNVYIDGNLAMRPKICLDVNKREYINVVVRTPPNQKKITQVCTENTDHTNRSKRFQLCTQIVTYFPQKQLQSALSE